VLTTKLKSGRDSVAGILTHYQLDGPGIESRLGRDFLRLSRPASCTIGAESLSFR
jgi:hypothetical protein